MVSMTENCPVSQTANILISRQYMIYLKSALVDILFFLKIISSLKWSIESSLHVGMAIFKVSYVCFFFGGGGEWRFPCQRR